MPINVTIQGTLAHFVCSGTITFAEVMDANNWVLGHPSADRLTGQMIDFLDVDTYLLSEQEAILMASVDKSAIEYMLPNKIAFVVVKQDIIDILAQYVSALEGTAWQAGLFDDRQTAWAWLRG